MRDGSTGKQVAVATAAPPAYLEGDAVPLSTDLAGGLRVGGAGLGNVSPLNVLYQGFATFGSANSGLNDGDTINPPLVGFASRTVNEAASILQAPAGANVAMTLQGLNGRRWGQVKSSNVAPGLWMFRPGTNAQNPVQFADVFPTLVAGLGTPLTTISPSVKIEALFRKLNAADTTDCRFFFGFSYLRVLSPSGDIARIGMVGDGATGYRFGSVNCPDGKAGGGANAATDIDANAVQPAALVAPGTDIWKVGIKLVPPTPTQTGRWGAYVNDVLVATFTTTANFPRGYFSGVQINDGYRAIECGFGHYEDGAALSGPLISDPVVTVALDWSL